MQELEMEVILFDNENPKYNQDADILAQLFNSLHDKYPQMSIKTYKGQSLEFFAQYVDLEKFDKKYPVFILNGHVVSASKTPDVKDIESYIEQILF